MKKICIVLVKKNQQLPAFRGEATLPFDDGKWPDTLEHEDVIYTYSHTTNRRMVLNYKETLHHKMSSGWLPIAQMPKDGTKVLVWAEEMDEGEVAWHEEGSDLEEHYTHFHYLPPVPVTPQWLLDLIAKLPRSD